MGQPAYCATLAYMQSACDNTLNRERISACVTTKQILCTYYVYDDGGTYNLLIQAHNIMHGKFIWLKYRAYLAYAYVILRPK